MDIYVGNLPYSATEEDLKEFFGAYGEVKSVRIIMDKETGRSKGFAFVEMPNADEAHTAIEASEGSSANPSEPLMPPFLARLKWQVTPFTMGSSKAAITIL